MQTLEDVKNQIIHPQNKSIYESFFLFFTCSKRVRVNANDNDTSSVSSKRVRVNVNDNDTSSVNNKPKWFDKKCYEAQQELKTARNTFNRHKPNENRISFTRARTKYNETAKCKI